MAEASRLDADQKFIRANRRSGNSGECVGGVILSSLVYARLQGLDTHLDQMRCPHCPDSSVADNAGAVLYMTVDAAVGELE